MVKGNWERRVELAAQRRQQSAKDKKDQHRNPPVASAESVCTKLANSDDLLGSNSRMVVWLPEPADRTVCSEWQRTGDCSVKKCRLPHHAEDSATEQTISRLRHVFVLESHCEEPLCFPVPLQHLQPRDRKSVRFASVDGVCVYDSAHPATWQRWAEQRALLLLSASTLPLDVVLEDEDGEMAAETTDVDVDVDDTDRQVQLLYGTDREQDAMTIQSSSSCCLLNMLNKLLLAEVLSWLTTGDLYGLLGSTRSIRDIVLRDPTVRLRKHEALNERSRDDRRRREEEKRRRARQAHCKKSSKKDGFARGGPGGQR